MQHSADMYISCRNLHLKHYWYNRTCLVKEHKPASETVSKMLNQVPTGSLWHRAEKHWCCC